RILRPHVGQAHSSAPVSSARSSRISCVGYTMPLSDLEFPVTVSLRLAQVPAVKRQARGFKDADASFVGVSLINPGAGEGVVDGGADLGDGLGGAARERAPAEESVVQARPGDEGDRDAGGAEPRGVPFGLGP